MEEIADHITRRLCEVPFARGAVLGFDLQNRPTKEDTIGHSVAVVKDRVSRGFGALTRFHFFDPNYGVWEVETNNLGKHSLNCLSPPRGQPHQNREELLELQLPGHKLPILKMTKDERIKYAPIRSHDDCVLPVYGEEDQRVPKTWELTLLDP